MVFKILANFILTAFSEIMCVLMLSQYIHSNNFLKTKYLKLPTFLLL